MTRGRIINPLTGGPRYRDGATTYNQYRGVHFNIEVEDPRGERSARYRRRHPYKRYKQKKPWMK